MDILFISSWRTLFHTTPELAHMKLAHSLQNIQPSYIREILRAASVPGVISLAGGLPDSTQFPLSLMKPSLQALAEQPSLFQYGNTQGFEPLLDYFGNAYQLTNQQKALVCTGSQQALDLIARAFINPGDAIIMEAPSYLGALQVFGLAQANILSVGQNKDGPDLNQLETLFVQQDIKMFYGVPDFHNPTGVCWSLWVRKEVARLCQQYNVTLVEDIPYRELRFAGTALPIASSFCPEHALVLRSYSKIATPGIRIGLVYGNQEWIDALIKVKQGSDLHTSVPMQAVLLHLLQHNEFNLHLQNLRVLYGRRYQKLMEQLKLKLPAQCTANPVDGGMFIWLTLTELADCDILAVAQAALKNGVAVVPSCVFYQPKEKQVSALRLNFTHAREEELVLAVDRLKAVVPH